MSLEGWLLSLKLGSRMTAAAETRQSPSRVATVRSSEEGYAFAGKELKQTQVSLVRRCPGSMQELRELCVLWRALHSAAKRALAMPPLAMLLRRGHFSPRSFAD